MRQTSDRVVDVAVSLVVDEYDSRSGMVRIDLLQSAYMSVLVDICPVLDIEELDIAILCRKISNQ